MITTKVQLTLSTCIVTKSFMIPTFKNLLSQQLFKMQCNIINYGCHTMHYIPMTSFLYNWRSTLLTSFQLHQTPNPPLATTNLFPGFMSLCVFKTSTYKPFCIFLFCFQFFFLKQENKDLLKRKDRKSRFNFLCH